MALQLVLFDLDNTLLAGDSDYLWGRFLAEKGAVDAFEYESKNREYYQLYLTGKLDIQEFLAFSLAPLTRFPLAQLLTWREEFVDGWIRPIMTKIGQEKIKFYQQQNATVAIITATQNFITAPIADAFGVPHLIATEAELINGFFTGKVLGTPCFREGKIAKLRDWLNGRTWSHLTFYSDSQNDIPLLSLADVAIAVDPDPTLAAYAQSQGWAIESFQNQPSGACDA
jgi:HAD superfamily hydrolase (TIGR01490 family)